MNKYLVAWTTTSIYEGDITRQHYGIYDTLADAKMQCSFLNADKKVTEYYVTTIDEQMKVQSLSDWAESKKK